ncbi:MAG: hypothetical protein WC389_00145 [Lutibacter sp.]
MTDKTSTQEKTPVNIEKEIAWLIEGFNMHLNCLESPQKKLHSSLMCLDEQSFSDEEKLVVSSFLNDVLAFTFTLKDRPDDIKKFIEYHT